MGTLTRQSTQELMQLILKSSKRTQKVMESLQLAQGGDLSGAREVLELATQINIEAHNLQTSLIQAEPRGERGEVSLLAIHAQDHFMNSHLLLELADVFLHQIEEVEQLKKKIEKLEQVGEKT